jgi:fluoride exporter
MTALAVALGGAAGALARWAVDGWIGRRPPGFPWATFAVNVSGAFLVGVLVAFFDQRVHLAPWLRTGLTLGFVGAYTTFSTWILETARLIDAGIPWLAVANLTASVAAGFAALLLGFSVGRAI